ncbi:hypothetical protein OG21DRAFT_773511 [Imleria badia]|nr:hypothetical protein OG21DRAFT_773511 [Imleria badia]
MQPKRPTRNPNTPSEIPTSCSLSAIPFPETTCLVQREQLTLHANEPPTNHPPHLKPQPFQDRRGAA